MAEKKIKDLMAQIKNLRIACSILIVILLIGAIVLSVGFGVYGKNTDDWFKKQEQQAEQELPEDQPMVVECESTSTLMLSSGAAVTAADGSTSQTLTATVVTEQDELTNRNLTWSVAFNNASSAWATGKTVTDYVTITPSEDTFSCEVTCAQAFGEQIIVSVKANSNSAAKASATVDYIKRIKSISYTVNTSNNGKIYIVNDSTSTYSNSLLYTVTYDTGTINGEVKMKNIKLGMSNDLYSAAKTKSGYTNGSWNFPQIAQFSGTDSNSVFTFKAPVYGGWLIGGGSESVWYKLNDWFKSTNGFTVDVYAVAELTYDGESVQSYNAKMGSSATDMSHMTALLKVSSVSLDSSALVF